MATKRAQRTLGEVFTDAREALDPTPGYEAIGRRLFVEVSHTTIANYHADAVKVPDVEIVQALVDFYGLALADLPPEVRERCERLRDRLVAASGGRRRYTPRDSNPEPADIAGIVSGIDEARVIAA